MISAELQRSKVEGFSIEMNRVAMTFRKFERDSANGFATRSV